MTTEKGGQPTKDQEEKRRQKFALSVLMGHDVNSINIDDSFSGGVVGLASKINDSELQRMVREGLQARILIELAPMAVKILKKQLLDKNTSEKTLRDICKYVLGVAGFVAPKAPETPGSSGKSLAEQSTAQLHRFLADAQRELSNRAAPVLEGQVVAPEVAPEDGAELADLLE